MSRTTAPLSDAACRLAKPTDRAYKLFDGDGLYLLVQPNGRKGWRLRYVKPDGREGLTSFGNYPVIGLADARRKRLEVKRMLADGIDPIETKHQAKAEAVIKGRTFESVALDWHTEMSAKWAPGHSKTVMSRLKTHVFPLIGARAIIDLDTHDLMQPLEAIKKRGTIDVALRVQNYLQSIMREAKRLRLITVNPAYDLVGSIKASRVVHRPALSLSRLPELQERIDTYKGRALTRLTVMLSLHVFVRSSELRFARWSKFDLVFAGDAKPWRPMSENTVNNALRTMGYDTKTDICGHGFRSMACSALIESGLWSETAIERQMSHKERNNVRAAYIHKAEFIEERRLIMNWWSRYLEANRQEHVTPHEFANQTGANVTRLKAKRGATE